MSLFQERPNHLDIVNYLFGDDIACKVFSFSFHPHGLTAPLMFAHETFWWCLKCQFECGTRTRAINLISTTKYSPDDSFHLLFDNIQSKCCHSSNYELRENYEMILLPNYIAVRVVWEAMVKAGVLFDLPGLFSFKPGRRKTNKKWGVKNLKLSKILTDSTLIWTNDFSKNVSH